MSINKIEIQDGSGNVYYPKTSIDSVIYNDNTFIEEKIIILERKLIELKSQLVNSINNKTGSSLTSNSTVDEMIAIINSIKTLEQATADANATASNILVDKTAYVNGTKITGTMPEKGAFAQTLSANGTINLGSGHYDSIKITQSLNTRGATTWRPSTRAQSIPSGTYLTGTQTIEGDTNLAPQNIRAGVSIFGVGGALSVQSLGGAEHKTGTIDKINYYKKVAESGYTNLNRLYFRLEKSLFSKKPIFITGKLKAGTSFYYFYVDLINNKIISYFYPVAGHDFSSYGGYNIGNFNYDSDDICIFEGHRTETALHNDYVTNVSWDAYL